MPDDDAQQPTEDEARAVGDTDVAAAPAENVPEHLRPTFTDGEPASSGAYAEVAEVLDDTQATGAGGET